MDYLQYMKQEYKAQIINQIRFKPCYKWITFNTLMNFIGGKL